MVDEIDLTIDNKRYTEAIQNLSGKEWKKIAKKAVGSASRVIVSQAKKELRKVTGRAKSTLSNAKHGWNLKKKNGVVTGVKKLEEGVRSKTHSDDITNIYAKVNIMADFRLKWFEKGTAERYTGRSKVNKKAGIEKVKYKDSKGNVRIKWRYKERQSGSARMYRGKMKPSDFFKIALKSSTSSAMQKQQEIIDRELQILWYKSQ